MIQSEQKQILCLKCCSKKMYSDRNDQNCFLKCDDCGNETNIFGVTGYDKVDIKVEWRKNFKENQQKMRKLLKESKI